MASDDLPDFGTEGYSLIMPFVVCASKGGPLDDHAFVAGVRFGKLDSLLNMRPSQHSEYVEPDIVPQLELLAMHHGYSFNAEPWEDHPTDWVLVTFGGGNQENEGEWS